MDLGLHSTSGIRLWSILAIGLAAALPAIAGNPRSPAQQRAGERVALEFERLAGSPQNARALVLGLRTGTAIVLTSAAPAQRIVFVPPTRSMGYGNIRRALTIARQEFTARGILRPTPEELHAVLVGGTVCVGNGTAARWVRYPGILPLRDASMRWGEIAHALAISPVRRPMNAASTARIPHLAAL